MQAGDLYIYNLSDNQAKFDTLTIQEGRFLYRGEVSEVTPYVLIFPNGMEQVIFVGPGEDLRYEATANDLKNYVVNGSDENKLMNKFRQETYTQNPSLTKGTARTYIKDNPSSPVAIYLLDKYFVQDEEAGNEEFADLLKTIKAKHPHNHYLLNIESKAASAEKSTVGKKLSDITLTQKNRKTIKLWHRQKDYNLIAFWATWMPNAYDLLWKIRRSHDGYKEKGILRIVAVSLDVEQYRWEDAIRPDSLGGIEHYCDGMGFESKAVKTLGIDEVPCYLLTDKNHTVLEKSNDVGKLEETLKKHLQPKKVP